MTDPNLAVQRPHIVVRWAKVGRGADALRLVICVPFFAAPAYNIRIYAVFQVLS